MVFSFHFFVETTAKNLLVFPHNCLWRSLISSLYICHPGSSFKSMWAPVNDTTHITEHIIIFFTTFMICFSSKSSDLSVTSLTYIGVCKNLLFLSSFSGYLVCGLHHGRDAAGKTSSERQRPYLLTSAELVEAVMLSKGFITRDP